MGRLAQFGMENYRLKVGIILKLSVNIADFYGIILEPDCSHTSTPKYVNTL